MSLKQNYFLIIIFLLLINTVNIITIFLFNITNNIVFINIFPAIKDLMLLFIFGTVLLQQLATGNFHYNRTISIIIVITFFLLILYPLLFFFSDAPLTNRLYNLRMLIMFPIAFWTFINIKIDKNTFNKINIFFQKLTLVLLYFGIIEYLLTTSFWEQLIGLSKYKQSRFLGETEVVRYLSADLKFITGEYVRRMMSFYAEPTTFGAFVTFVFCLSTFGKNELIHGRKISILALICGFLIFSKLFLLSLLFVLYYKIFKPKLNFYPLFLFTVLL